MTDEITDEGVLDPWVKEWMQANPFAANPPEEFTPELLALARGPVGGPVTREIGHVEDDVVYGVPVRIYRNEESPAATIVYFHGGGHVIGSIGLMDGVAREIAHHTGAEVVSVEYRLAPEHPYPAGLEDCEAVTRWACARAERVFVCGESAGGNLAAAVALRFRDTLAGQVLIYPRTGGPHMHPSQAEFDGLVISQKLEQYFWDSYRGGRDIADDPFATPLAATDLNGLPPALVVLGGCDMLRDEGRAYGAKMRDGGVDVDEVCYPGQVHGFVNFQHPAAALAFERIGAWFKAQQAP